MTIARHQCSKAHVEGHGFDWATAVFATSAIHQGSTSRLLWPFQISIPRNRFCHGDQTASDPRLYRAYKRPTNGCTRVPARLFESPRHSGATDEGGTHRLLREGLPGVPEYRRPMKPRLDPPWPANWHRRRSLRLTWKVRRPVVRSKLGLGKLTCKHR